MLAAHGGWIQIIDSLLLAAGAVFCILTAIRLCRSRLRHNPLGKLGRPTAAPPLVVPVTIIFLYFTLLWISVSSMLTEPMREAAAELGSGEFLLIQALDTAAKLAICALMIGLLILDPPRWSGVHRLRWPSLLGTALFVTLALVALTTLQLYTGQIVWHWLHPDESPPLHPILECLHSNAWGAWGAALLTFSAIVVAPLAEELFFRGLLAPALWKATGSAWLAAVLSGAAFGFIHGQPQDIAPLITMGVVLAVLRFATGSVLLCVLVHALFNARTIIAALLAPELLRPAPAMMVIEICR